MRNAKPTDAIVRDIHRHAMQDFPNESCGLIVKVGRKSQVVRCKNVADDPRRFFVMDADDQQRAEEMGEVIAVWHTHPNGRPVPSEADRAGCTATELPWFITAIWKEGEDFRMSDTTVTLPDPDFKMPYLGRPYVFGVFDCYSLVTDYMEGEFGIVMDKKLHSRIPKWWEKGINFFGDEYDALGFNRLIDQEPQPGDLFLMQIGATVPNHIAVYLGDDMILHHCHDRLSSRAVYGGFWDKHTTHHLRHKSKC